MKQRKHFLTLMLALFSVCIFAQMPKPSYLTSAKFSAVGAGTSGVPTINYNIPAGKNRIMVITIAGERYHNPYGGNNMFGNDPLVSVNGIGATALRTRIYEYGIDEKPSSYTFENAIIYITEQDGLPTGLSSITFGGINTPKSVGDKMSVIVSVYENAKSITDIAYTGSQTFTGTTVSSTSGTAFTPPTGRTASDILYLADGASSQSTTLSATGWTSPVNMNDVITNNSGSILGGVTNSYATNEPDGISHMMGYRTYSSGNPSVTFTRTPTGRIFRGTAYILALAPFASPQVSGYVVTPALNSATSTGTNAGGLWMNVVDTSTNMVVDVVAVAANGTFSTTAGKLMEGNNYNFILSKNAGFVGTTTVTNPIVVELNTGWGTVAEGLNSTTSDGTPNGIFNYTAGATSVNTLRFAIKSCAAGTTAPTVQNISNVCPATTANLNSAIMSSAPAGASPVWFTNNTHTGTALSGTQITQAGAGTYYAFYYDSVGNCYSPASAAVTVTIGTCLTPFTCDSSVYLSQSSGTSSPTTLYNVNAVLGTYTAIGSAAAVTYNATAFNPVDGFLYAIQYNTNKLVKIGNDGNYIIVGTVSGLANAIYNSGDFDAAGNYYIKETGTTTRIYKITNVATAPVATAISFTGGGFAVSDLAYSTTTNALYGTGDSNHNLIKFDLSTNVVTQVGGTTVSDTFGGMVGASGNIYGFTNGGGFYQFNLTTGKATKLFNTPSSTYNDAAHCVTSPLCLAGTTAPPVQNISNICPATTVDLGTAHTGTAPSTSSLVWFINNTHTGTALSGTQITQAGAGTYYAFYYDSVGNCYSPASAAVKVTIGTCCNAGTTQVQLSGSTLTN